MNPLNLVLIIGWIAVGFILGMYIMVLIYDKYFKGVNQEAKQPELSQEELFAFKQLAYVNKETLWGIAISEVVANPTPERIRKLFCSLKEQNHDNPESMRKILGDAYPIIMSL